MMEAESVTEMLINTILKHMVTWEDLTTFSHHESLKYIDYSPR
jgi:hypothetical protein